MIAAGAVTLVLLAAGRSRRFGERDKLEQDLLGRPLGLHIVAALADIPFGARLAVTSGCSLDFAAHGYRVIRNDRPERGMASSLGLGVADAADAGAAAVLIVLADMPRVTAAQVGRLLDAADTADAVVASSDGIDAKPPALFGAARFDRLTGLRGDAGARDLIRAGRHVVTTPAELIDIDTPEELARLDALLRAGARDHSWRSASIGLSAAARLAGK